MAMASAGGANYLYLANFHAGTVEVYDKNFAAHSFGSNAFVDSTIPSGYAPFNVQADCGNKLVVTYAKQDAAKHDDVPGPGNGFVDVYDTQGNLQLRLAHVLFLNSPWGVVVAPSSFSGFGNDLLIGNFGSGGDHGLQRHHRRLDRQHVQRQRSASADRRAMGPDLRQWRLAAVRPTRCSSPPGRLARNTVSSGRSPRIRVCNGQTQTALLKT